MSKILECLHEEHINVALLMELLGRQLEEFAAGDRPDYELMQEIMHYMVNFPDQFHHPKEDLIFECLRQRDKLAEPVVHDLTDEHALLTRKGQRVLDSLDTAVNDFMFSRISLEAMIRDYRDAMMRHMSREEAYVFPMALRTLNDEDWADLDAKVALRDDPLFGDIVDGEYSALRQVLDDRSKTETPPE